MADFDTLLVFLVYERAKGSQSRWAPYFEAIGDLEMIADWTEEAPGRGADTTGQRRKGKSGWQVEFAAGSV
jgi:hypothetical protein